MSTMGMACLRRDFSEVPVDNVLQRTLYNDRSVSPKTLTAFRLDPELIDGLKVIKKRTGAPIAEQVRRAIVAWLKQHNVKAS